MFGPNLAVLDGNEDVIKEFQSRRPRECQGLFGNTSHNKKQQNN